MRRDLIALVIAALGPAAAQAQGAKPDPAAHYFFYLHGRIVEEQGAAARDPEYGANEYKAIVSRFRDSGFVVVSEMRQKSTDPGKYADSVAGQMQRLISGGVPESHITVVGASKGAAIAMLVSHRVTLPIRYVLLANCNDDI